MPLARRYIIPLLPAASGAAGLVYQICWIRSASLTIGSTSLALAFVLAIFFAGLSIGSAAFGRLAVGTSQPLRIFAYLEWGVAVSGLLALPWLRLVASLLDERQPTAEISAVPGLFELSVVALAVLPAAVLMGGALPILCAQDLRSRRRGRVALLYGLNTLGAAIGCAAAGLWLIPTVGVLRTTLVAAAMNLTVGAVAMWLSRTGEASGSIAAPADSRIKPGARVPAAGDRRWLNALFFLTGAVALASQVLWTRFAALVITSTIATYTLTITVVLVGIALGSLLAWRVRAHPLRTFGVLQALTSLSVLAVVHLPPRVWTGAGSEPWIYLVLFLPASILSGASFPVALTIVSDRVEQLSRQVGRVTALNTLGGIAGAVGAAIALPILGLQRGFLVVTGASLLAALVTWIRLDREGRALRWALSTSAMVGWLAVPVVLPGRIPDSFLTRNGTLLAVKEGKQSNLAVSRLDGRTLLTSDQWWQGQDERSHQSVSAHVPMLLHPSPRRVLVIGVGAGQTPARFVIYDIERLDAVDIDPDVFDLIRSHFDSRWMADPRVHLIGADGRQVVARSSESYDVMSIEAGQLQRSGVAAFYTRDFYRQARSRLAPGGVISQFVPLSSIGLAEFRSVVRTFTEVFPQSILWYNRGEPLLLGVNGSRFDVDPRRLSLIEAPGPVHDDLAFPLWGGREQWLSRPEVFLSGFLVGTEGLRRLASGGELLDDDRPVLDYRAGTASRSGQPEAIPGAIAAHLESIETALPTIMPPPLIERVRENQRRNVGDMMALSQLRLASGADTIPRLLRAVDANPANVQALSLLGTAYLTSGRTGAALDVLRRAEQINPDDARVKRDLGTALWQARERDQAIARFREAASALPADAESHYYLGAALKVLGNASEGDEHLRRALVLRPDHSLARSALEAGPR